MTHPVSHLLVLSDTGIRYPSASEPATHIVSKLQDSNAYIFDPLLPGKLIGTIESLLLELSLSKRDRCIDLINSDLHFYYLTGQTTEGLVWARNCTLFISPEFIVPRIRNFSCGHTLHHVRKRRKRPNQTG